MKTLRNVLFASALAVAGVLACAPGASAEVVKLKDGTSLSGKIENETADYLFVVVKIGDISQRKLVAKSDIKEIVRDGGPAPAGGAAAPASVVGEAPAATTTPSAAPSTPVPPGATKITVVTLEEEVGPFMNADALKHSVEIIPSAEKPDILVIKINSGGGALLEVPKLMDEIQKKLKREYRVVGWIESAISAAAMTAMNIEELYFFDRGHIGGAVGFSMSGRKATAVKGVELERLLDLGQQIAKNGRYDPLVIRAMQELFVLSCNVDEQGRVTWQNDENGQFLVNPPDRILTLDSIEAKKYGISKGNANTLPELAKVMGVTEWVETGKAADAYQQEFRANVKKAQVELNRLEAEFNLFVGEAMSAQDASTRQLKVGQAKQTLAQMESWAHRAPSLEVYMGLDKEFFRDRREELDKMLRKS